MSHGTPDWAEMAPRSTVYGGIALDELAARLGSIVTFDRRGDVVFASSFEEGLAPFYFSPPGLGGSVSWTAEHSRNGGFAAKIVTTNRTTLSMSLVRVQALPVLGNIGEEFSFTVDDDIGRVELRLELDDSVNAAEGRIRYLPPTGALEYWTSLGAWEEKVSGLALNPAPSHFHTMKLVVDFVNKVYKRAILNSVGYSLANIPLEEPDTAATAYLAAGLWTYPAIDDNITIYADDVIITQNEP